jgi:hypothetical protein
VLYPAPPRTTIDKPLVIGSILFGMGWGYLVSAWTCVCVAIIGGTSGPNFYVLNADPQCSQVSPDEQSFKQCTACPTVQLEDNYIVSLARGDKICCEQ